MLQTYKNDLFLKHYALRYFFSFLFSSSFVALRINENILVCCSFLPVTSRICAYLYTYVCVESSNSCVLA